MQLDWYQAIAEAFTSNHLNKISKGVDFAVQKHGIKSVYPKKELIFRAFELTPLTTVKAVMIGLEPTAETASGLLFESTHAPADGLNDQLLKLYQVHNHDYPNGFPMQIMSGLTSHWAEDGVLMLNLSLTARAGQAIKHLAHWSFLIDKVLEVLKTREIPIAFIPFGKTPTEKIEELNLPSHHREFKFGNGMFLEINKWLESVGREPIDW